MVGFDNPLGELARRLAAQRALSPADDAALVALPYVRRTLDPSAYLLREGDPPTQCMMLISGYAYRQKLTGDGARQIVSLHLPGEVLDLQNLYLDVADHNVQALTRVEVAMIPRLAMRDVATARPAVAHAIMVYLLREAAILREWILNIGRRDARARLAHLLCEFAARMDSQGQPHGHSYELPMTQEQLGDALGLTSVHVNRTLRGLEAEGLISRNKRHVSFPSWEALREAADFHGRYLHLDQRSD